MCLASFLAGCDEDCIASEGMLLSAYDRSGGDHFFGGIDLKTGIEFCIPLPIRGHAPVLHPTRRHVAIIARRPGREFRVIDWEHGECIQRVQAPSNRHFFGHAVFDNEGRYLYATENIVKDVPNINIEPLLACVGVYDANNRYRRVGEISAFGIGTHSIDFMSDGKTLVLANGGIYTHPTFGRQKLNIGTMDPSLVFVDVTNGNLVSEHRLDDYQLSIRHISVRNDDTVILGLQYEGSSSKVTPLIAMHKHGKTTLLKTPQQTLIELDQYIGSVVIHESTGHFAATSPRGNQTVFFDADGNFLGKIHGKNMAGVTVLGNYFVISGGDGYIRFIMANTIKLQREIFIEHIHWDNHLTVVGV